MLRLGNATRLEKPMHVIVFKSYIPIHVEREKNRVICDYGDDIYMIHI
jgi:hypothetical protein